MRLFDQHSWRLRSYVSGLLVVTSLVTFTIVGGAILLVRIPMLERESRTEVALQAEEFTAKMEMLLGSLEAQVSFFGQTLQLGVAEEQANSVLDRALGDGRAFRAIYFVSGQGKVVAAGLTESQRLLRKDLLGSDVSANQLFRQAMQKRQPVWSDKYLSALSGAVTVGLAVPVGVNQVLLAEVPLSYLLSSVELALADRSSSAWLVDKVGEVLVDSQGGRFVNVVNMAQMPVLQAAMQGRELPPIFEIDGRSFYPAVSRFGKLDWYAVVGSPVGWGNPRIRSATIVVLGGFVGSVLMGLLLAPFWAVRLSRPINKIVGRAEQISHGEAAGPWPRSVISELNVLSSDLERMASSLQEREQKLLAIFNATPVPMSLIDGTSNLLVDVNKAWCEQFARKREDVLGRRPLDIGLWRSVQERAEKVAISAKENPRIEVWLVRGDGVEVLCQAFRYELQLDTNTLNIWATIDITELRRTEDALRDLNAELETRVASRTGALAQSNAQLSSTIETLKIAQNELVRSEKMAALGSLVAGVSHELNTPLGNGLMAVSAMGDAVRNFKTTMQAGLRRSDLDAFVARVEQGADISIRNLRRAADLVTSFKQVAVDQTSSQRRSFELSEVVDEMVVSLMPSLRRTSHDVVVDVPRTGLLFDSFPGPLGQTLGNLINNAVLHAFEGRPEGTIRITGERDGADHVLLRVSDNGNGIAPEMLDRIFEPFVTTKMGRGGTGLGLHIAYNAVTSALGGTLTVHSVQGQGATFEMRLPLQAPVSA